MHDNSEGFSNSTLSQQQAILQAVLLYDSNELRILLDEDISVTFTDEANRSLLHLICVKDSTYDFEVGTHFTDYSNFSNVCTIIYMLVDGGIDLEAMDKYGNTCLFYAAKNRDFQLCEVLLQCGADMWIVTEDNKYLFDSIMENEEEKDLQEIFHKFYPGLWKAVESEDIYQVRKLINLWCKTDLKKNGYSLKDIAFDVGNEGIISLVLGIFNSMEMVFHILAKNTKAVKKMLETSRKQLRLDLRKMSERGAPILYYLIQSKDVPIIELFINEGCQVYTVMLDEHGYDMPVLFTALKPDMSLDVIEALLPKNKKHQEEMLYKLLYKGRTILEVALEMNVSLELFSVIVDRGGPLLVSDRNQFNQTVKDLALLDNKKLYAEVIDEHILNWISYPSEYPNRRQHLALYGWEFNTYFQKYNQEKIQENIHSQEFFSHLSEYQLQIKQLADVVENGNNHQFHELKIFKHEHGIFESNLSWHGKMTGDGLPLLHRAVLFNHPNLVEVILNEKPSSESIDKLFDQHHRTALHYAYACSSTNSIRKLLLDHGCSEHVLDKSNKEPLDFREKQDSLMMIELLDRLKYKNTTLPEPNPWSEIIDNEGFLDKVPCSNSWCKSSQGKESCTSEDNSSCDILSDSSDEESINVGNTRSYCSII